uniref:Transmembrane serine protease 15 n=1 Tax=Cyprinodon variegatus TaxID=28743 RepID=A0A3Q2EAE8_CYPVA
SDGSMCIPSDYLCDGVPHCSDSSDEATISCVTPCDGQFLLEGLSGSFRSSAAETYNNSMFCRWIIRVSRGFSVQFTFSQFETETNIDTLRIYEGVGPNKVLTAELSGSTPPGTVWLLSDQSSVEFTTDEFNSLSGFKASYTAIDTSELSGKKGNCSFEDGLCFWRQQQDDEGDWFRTSGSTFPPSTGPSADHTFGNSSGFYIVTAPSPGQWRKSFRIQSPPLTPPTPPMCLSFWYHMFGDDVYRLRVLLIPSTSLPDSDVIVLFQKDGNFGDTWNYGQVTLNLTSEAMVQFEAVKNGGMWNDIALDDITLKSDICGPAPPEPTNVPPPTTMPPIPADCGGPFDLWEPNSTFSSPNYPHSYGNMAKCLWTLHALDGQNIQLHFLDFDVEATYDMVEVRDGAGPNSTILAVLTGSTGPAHDLFSTSGQMTIWFFTDSGGYGRGFRANFTGGVDLGSPAPCAVGQFQCQMGACIHGNAHCDGVVNCPDGSDEADCGMSLTGYSFHRFNTPGLCLCLDMFSEQSFNRCCSYFLTCEERVVGGTNAEKGAWPWMVSLHWKGRHVCGASLIGSSWLLTAAHCVYGKNIHLQYWSALLGLHAQSYMYSEDVQTRYVDQIIIHKEYNRLSKHADIAMMHLQQPINFTQWVQPVCLPAEGQSFTAGKKCFIAGWGRDAEGGSPADVLQEAQLPLINQDQCQEFLPEYNITSSMLCAGYPEGGVDSCQGDSGGPLMCVEDGHWTVIGVTSFGVGCARPQKPGGYARVSAFVSWILWTFLH